MFPIPRELVVPMTRMLAATSATALSLAPCTLHFGDQFRTAPDRALRPAPEHSHGRGRNSGSPEPDPEVLLPGHCIPTSQPRLQEQKCYLTPDVFMHTRGHTATLFRATGPRNRSVLPGQEEGQPGITWRWPRGLQRPQGPARGLVGHVTASPGHVAERVGRGAVATARPPWPSSTTWSSVPSATRSPSTRSSPRSGRAPSGECRAGPGPPRPARPGPVPAFPGLRPAAGAQPRGPSAPAPGAPCSGVLSPVTPLGFREPVGLLGPLFPDLRPRSGPAVAEQS